MKQYILFLILSALFSPYSYGLASNIDVDIPKLSPAYTLCVGDSCSARLSYTESTLLNPENTVTVSVSEEMRVRFYFSGFSYMPGFGDTDNGISGVLNITLQQQRSEDPDSELRSITFPIEVDKNGTMSIHGGKEFLTYSLSPGVYEIVYSGILKNGTIATLSSNSSVGISNSSSNFVLSMVGYALEQTSFMPTTPYPPVQKPLGEPFLSLDVPCDGNYVCQVSYGQSNRQASVVTYGYSDGFGNGMETVKCHYSPSGADVVEIIEYDVYGRLSKQVLPSVCTMGNNGAFVGLASAKALSVQSNEDGQPYQSFEYEQCPQGRVLLESGAGSG